MLYGVLGSETEDDNKTVSVLREETTQDIPVSEITRNAQCILSFIAKGHETFRKHIIY